MDRYLGLISSARIKDAADYKMHIEALQDVRHLFVSVNCLDMLEI